MKGIERIAKALRKMEEIIKIQGGLDDEQADVYRQLKSRQNWYLTMPSRATNPTKKYIPRAERVRRRKAQRAARRASRG